MIAQALVEKGFLDSAAAGMSDAVTNLATAMQERPLVVLAILAVIAVLVFGRRR